MEFDAGQLAGGWAEENNLAAAVPQTQAMYKQIRQPNLTERLEMQIADAEAKLSRLKEAHAELKKNPGIENLLNLLQRV
jgi:hypothetical protein